jgi:hypothetical protein
MLSSTNATQDRNLTATASSSGTSTLLRPAGAVAQLANAVANRTASSAGVPRSSLPPIVWEKEKNNTIAEARQNNSLGSLTAKSVIAQGETTKHDTKDIYAFTISGNSRRNVNFFLSGLKEHVNLKLMDVQGNHLIQSTLAGATQRQFQQSLAPGEYFVKVFNGSSNSKGSTYQLTLTDTTPNPVAPPPGSTPIPLPQPAAPTRQFIEVSVEQIRAIDKFDVGTDNSARADFYTKVKIDNGSEQKSTPVQNQDLIRNVLTTNHVVSVFQRDVAINLSVFDQDLIFDDQADINPALGTKDLKMTLNTQTGDLNIPGWGTANIYQKDPIVVSGQRSGDSRKDGPRAEVAFRINRIAF